jgi:hypothetical protein
LTEESFLSEYVAPELLSRPCFLKQAEVNYMPLWFEIAVVVLLALIVLQLYGIEGNIGIVAQELSRLKSAVNTACGILNDSRTKGPGVIKP